MSKSQILNLANMSFNSFRKNQILAKSSEFTVLCQCSFTCNNRGSYMSAHVLLNLLNELGKRDKMRGLLSI